LNKSEAWQRPSVSHGLSRASLEKENVLSHKLLWRRVEAWALARQFLAPARSASDATVTLWASAVKARLAARATQSLEEPELDWADLSDWRHVDASILLLLGGTHTVTAALLIHNLSQAQLAEEVALVDDQLANAARANFHHVQSPAKALSLWSRASARGRASDEAAWGQLPSGDAEKNAKQAAGASHDH